MELSIRSLTPEDADQIEQLYAQSVAHLRALGDDTEFQFNARIYLRDGFGEQPAFAGLGAVWNGNLVGYLLYTFGYDPDRAIRYLFILDLLVDQGVRNQGNGKALMRTAASVCQEAGGRELFWAVYAKNTLAQAFYKRLGAEAVTDLQFMCLKV